jgi:hypothetical protein
MKMLSVGSFAVILVTKRMSEVLNDKDKLIMLTESPYGKSISENLGKLIENLKGVRLL